jgi:hypothetical protein
MAIAIIVSCNIQLPPVVHPFCGHRIRRAVPAIAINGAPQKISGGVCKQRTGMSIISVFRFGTTHYYP